MNILFTLFIKPEHSGFIKFVQFQSRKKKFRRYTRYMKEINELIIRGN